MTTTGPTFMDTPDGIAEGHTMIDTIGELIFETVLETASGRSTVSEDLDLSRDGFVPSLLGAVT